jgi:hypothetical protein
MISPNKFFFIAAPFYHVRTFHILVVMRELALRSLSDLIYFAIRKRIVRT